MITGHRGAPSYRPEHTLASYELAFRQGAQSVDVDLVPTADGHLVARHENELSRSTDVERHPAFAERRTTKVIDGSSVCGWFTEDFTLAELRTLRATEPIPRIRPHNTVYNGLYEIPTYQEVLDRTQTLGAQLGRELGTCPEVKHSTHFISIGLPIEPELLRLLEHNNLNRSGAPVLIQSFEVDNLRRLSRQVGVGLVQLVAAGGAPADFSARGDSRGYADLLKHGGLREIAEYATHLAPSKDLVLPRGAAGERATPTSLVSDAHAAGLRVAVYTLRAENAYLPEALRSGADPSEHGDAITECREFLSLNVDALFTDNPDIAALATEQHRDGVAG